MAAKRTIWILIAPVAAVLTAAVWGITAARLDTSHRLKSAAGSDGAKSNSVGLAQETRAGAKNVGTPGVSMASLILALAGPQKLKAITPEVRDNEWVRRIMPEIASLPAPFARSGEASIEVLLQCKIDFVALWTSNEKAGRRLSEAGIPVLYISYATPDEMILAIRKLGSALGADEEVRSGELIRYYESNIARVHTLLNGLPESARPTVYYASISPFLTEGRDSMVDAWINAAGAINVAARSGLSQDKQIGLEDVLQWDPEIIVTLGAAQKRDILSDERWKKVRAVKNGRVYVNPRGVNAWCTRAAEASLQVLWAAKVFHPDRTAALNIEQETRGFYSEFYHYDLNDEELAHMLRGEEPPVKQSVQKKGYSEHD